MDSLVLRLLEEVARRQNLPLDTADLAGLAGRGALSGRPRLGAVLDLAGTDADGGNRMIPLGPYHFDPAQSTLYDGANARDIRLTEKERNILLALLGAAGGVVGRDVLLGTVWGYASGVETHTLETHIYRLRQKIETDPARPALLLTAEDGYCLSASVFADAGKTL